MKGKIMPSPGSLRTLRQRSRELAREAAGKRLRQCWDPTRLHGLGALLKDGGRLELPCLHWRFGLDEDSLAPRLLPTGAELSVLWQVLVLDYLCAPVPHPPGRMVSFADFAEARTYAGPFECRVLRRLSATVGRGKDGFIRAAQRCGGTCLYQEPLRYAFRFFPRLEIEVVCHASDDEFPASCNVLFPDNAPSLFSMEDVIVAAEMLVATLGGKSPTD